MPSFAELIRQMIANHPVGLLEVIVGGPAGLALLALPVMKYYARPLALWHLWLIAFGIFFPITIILFAIHTYCFVIGAGMAIFGWAVVAAFILAGISLSWCLKRQGFSKGFPGIGARTMFSLVIFDAILLVVASLVGLRI